MLIAKINAHPPAITTVFCHCSEKFFDKRYAKTPQNAMAIIAWPDGKLKLFSLTSCNSIPGRNRMKKSFSKKTNPAEVATEKNKSNK